MFPIVIAAALWGKAWRGTRVTFRCDNDAVVWALSSRSTRDPSLMHLLRCLFFLEASFQFEHEAHHLPGKANLAVDALSRNHVVDFFLICPQAPKSPIVVPPDSCKLLSDRSLKWTSPNWKRLFSSSLQAASQREL